MPMEGSPPVANQIDLFMHFLGAGRDGLVARPVEMDKILAQGPRICLDSRFAPASLKIGFAN